ncbi:MAG: hypothetical protein HRT90_10485, partial [Candidatus Margulisbacteria bacterium]|nr:hypothetical protein [Candidatus Margulisiibacteriota bacterium]
MALNNVSAIKGINPRSTLRGLTTVPTKIQKATAEEKKEASNSSQTIESKLIQKFKKLNPSKNVGTKEFTYHGKKYMINVNNAFAYEPEASIYIQRKFVAEHEENEDFLFTYDRISHKAILFHNIRGFKHPSQEHESPQHLNEFKELLDAYCLEHPDSIDNNPSPNHLKPEDSLSNKNHHSYMQPPNSKQMADILESFRTPKSL